MRCYEACWPVGATSRYGTVVEPEGRGPFPAVVFVAGSGPTDRDWNTPALPGTNGSGRLLADALGRVGFASVRYDKRAVGPHAEESLPVSSGEISMQSHVDEVSGAVNALLAELPVRRDKVFGLGNSEGTLHVLNYALGQAVCPFAGVVLSAPPGRPVGQVARWQLSAQLASAGVDGPSLLALYDAAITRFLAGQPVEPSPDLPDGIMNLLLALENPVNLPFVRQLWEADASTLLAQLSVPALVVIGKKDIQVDWRADGEALQSAAAGRGDVTFSFPEHANHVLKYEDGPVSGLRESGAGARYNAAGTRLDPDAVTAIVAWLQKHI